MPMLPMLPMLPIAATAASASWVLLNQAVELGHLVQRHAQHRSGVRIAFVGAGGGTRPRVHDAQGAGQHLAGLQSWHGADNGHGGSRLQDTAARDRAVHGCLP